LWLVALGLRVVELVICCLPELQWSSFSQLWARVHGHADGMSASWWYFLTRSLFYN